MAIMVIWLPLSNIDINMYICIIYGHVLSQHTQLKVFALRLTSLYERRKANSQLWSLLSRDREYKEIDDRTGFGRKRRTNPSIQSMDLAWQNWDTHIFFKARTSCLNMRAREIVRRSPVVDTISCECWMDRSRIFQLPLWSSPLCSRGPYNLPTWKPRLKSCALKLEVVVFLGSSGRARLNAHCHSRERTRVGPSDPRLELSSWVNNLHPRKSHPVGATRVSRRFSPA